MARPQPKGGSRKGKPNKNTAALKDMILAALNAKDGQVWLQTQMDANPIAFMTLLGRVLPLQVNADANVGLTINLVKFGNHSSE